MSAVWTPADLGSSLALWLDASDASTITLDGNRVVQWDDKSGNDNHTVNPVASKQPVYEAGGMGGQPGLRFDGVDDFLEAADSPSLDIAGTELTVFVVAKLGETDYGLFLNKEYSYEVGVLNGSFQAAIETATPGAWAFAGTQAVSLGSPNIYGFRYDSSPNWTFTLDGTLSTAAPGGGQTGPISANNQPLQIGSRANTTWADPQFDGTISEVILVSSALSVEEMQQVEGYLAQKWGLEGNLPDDHPYKTSAPVCFAAGTRIATPHGAVAVERIRPGDLVITRDHGPQPVLWVGCQRVGPARLARAERLRPVRIPAGALGRGVPSRDLVVSQQHRLLLEGPGIAHRFGDRQVLAAARHLSALPGIGVVLPQGGIAYHHLLLAGHELVCANGAWAETLFTGPWAMRLMGPAQRAEIVTLFPGLAAPGAPPHAAPARRFLKGGEVRDWAMGRSPRPLKGAVAAE